MRHPDYVVVGTGRSGTSFVAHVLRTRLNVCMGHLIDTVPSEFHRWGVHEDPEIKVATRQLIGKRMSATEWLEEFTRIHKRNGRCSGPLTGVKHPDLSFLDLEDWDVIRPGLILWAWRKPEQVEASKRRARNPFGPWRTAKALRYLQQLYDSEFNVLRIDLSIERSVDEIEEEIRDAGA